MHLAYLSSLIHDISGLLPDSSGHINQLEFEDDWCRKWTWVSFSSESNCTNCPGYQPLGYPTGIHSSFSISTPVTATVIDAVAEDLSISCSVTSELSESLE